MKKIGLIALALVLSLGLLGVGLAQWTETLTISGTVATGELDVEFSTQVSNDPDGGTNIWDPTECGAWPTPKVTESWADWVGTRNPNGDVASTNCQLVKDWSGGSEHRDNQTLKITIDNAYPCYYGSVFFTIDNIGTIPAKIESFKLVEVSLDGQPTGSPGLVVVDGTTYYVNADNGNVKSTSFANADFSITLSGPALRSPIVPTAKARYGIICIHVEDGAEELTDYDFAIEIVAVPFNK